MQIIAKSAIATLLFAAAVFAVDAPVEGDPTKITGANGDAKAYPENPSGKAYWADFSKTKLRGGIIFTPAAGNNGVKVEVKLQEFPAEGGPFTYHVHDQPVPADGNCTGTKAHLDPFIRGQKVPCDPKRPESCEVGDLAGKHGKIPANNNGTFITTYNDLYITLNEGVGSFIGNRSIVIHTNDTKRYACANITEFKQNTPENNSGNRFGPGFWGCGLGVAVGLKFLLV